MEAGAGPGASDAGGEPELTEALHGTPSADTAGVLAGLDLRRLDDADLVAVVAAWDRLSSWVAAHQSRVVAELARREPPRLAPDSYVADTIACELAVTRRAAQVLVDRAWALASAEPVAQALSDGRLSVAKADAVLRGTEHLPAHLAARVQADALAVAASRTVPQIKDAVRRAEQTHAPQHALERHERARAERGVWLRPTIDAMAWVNALLPATDAMRVMTAVDALATSSAPDDPRGADARRADALTDLARTVLDRGTDLDGTPLPTRQGRRPHLQITITLAALCGASDTLAGYGPVPAALARQIAAEATWTFLAVDHRSGQVHDRSSRTYRPSAAVARAVLDRDITCTFPTAGSPHPAATSTTPSPTTTGGHRVTRRRPGTSPPCAATTTGSRPTPDGHPPTTPRPASPPGAHPTAPPTPATRNRSPSSSSRSPVPTDPGWSTPTARS